MNEQTVTQIVLVETTRRDGRALQMGITDSL